MGVNPSTSVIMQQYGMFGGKSTDSDGYDSDETPTIEFKKNNYNLDTPYYNSKSGVSTVFTKNPNFSGKAMEMPIYNSTYRDTPVDKEKFASKYPVFQRNAKNAALKQKELIQSNPGFKYLGEVEVDVSKQDLKSGNIDNVDKFAKKMCTSKYLKPVDSEILNGNGNPVYKNTYKAFKNSEMQPLFSKIGQDPGFVFHDYAVTAKCYGKLDDIEQQRKNVAPSKKVSTGNVSMEIDRCIKSGMDVKVNNYNGKPSVKCTPKEE